MSNKKIKIVLLTERRADYSRFKPLLKKILNDKSLEYKLIVSGMHILKSSGMTIKEIKKDKFKIAKIIPMFKRNKGDGISMVSGIAHLLKPLAKYLEKESPDLVLSGFDIGGNFSITLAAAHLNIPIAHIQGGERSGSIDESLRHAMSKFSNFHFVATNEAKKRLIKMGENKNNIFVVGCPSIDALLEAEDIPLSKIKKKYNFDFSKKFLLCIQHPVTTENNISRKQIKETMIALKKINLPVFVIMPNNDSGFKQIVDEIKFSNFKHVNTLPLAEYKAILKNCALLIGNSSSGIHEAATFKKAAINIGSRQINRYKTFNVIDVEHNFKKILNKLKFVLTNKNFYKKLRNIKNPYGNGNSSEKILKLIKKLDLKKNTQKINTY